MPLPTKLMTIGAKGAKTAAKATDQEALVESAKAADRAAAGRRAADVAKATEPMRMSEALGNLNLEGKGKLKVTQSDRTRVGGGNIGGAMFPGLSQVDPLYENLVWGVGKKGTASSLIRQSDPNTVWSTILGKEDQLKSNPIVFNRLYDAFKREAKAGLLDDELRQKINAGLEPTFGEGVDILDPKFRQKVNTFDKRVLVADLLLGKGIGGELRGGSIIPGSAILRQETEPLLLHPKQGGDVPTFAVGPRLFSLSGEVKERPDLHPGFPYLLTGEDKGVVVKPVPGEDVMIDFMARMQEAGKKPGYYEWTMGEAGRGLPSQDINEALLTYLQKKGYAEGGLAGSPGGIPQIAQELEAEYQAYQLGGAVKRAATTAAKAAGKTARQEALEMARDISRQSFVKPSQEKGVVYHGTNKDFKVFRKTLTPDDHVRGISVTDDPVSAGMYAEDKAAKQSGGEGANVIPLLVRAEKPMPYPQLEDWVRNKAVEKNFPIENPDDFAAFDVPPDTLLKWLKEEGYDAIDYRDDPMLGYGLRVFEPTQLKSAIGNRTYDPRDPDFTKAQGGPVNLQEEYQAYAAGGPINLEQDFQAYKGGGSVQNNKASEAHDIPEIHPEVLKYMSLDDLVNPERNFPRRYPGQTAPLPSDLASDSAKEMQDRRLKQGAIDALDWTIKNLPQPVNPVMQSLRNILDARKRRYGDFVLSPDVQEASGIVILPEELIPITKKDGGSTSLNEEFRSYAAGGAAKMKLRNRIKASEEPAPNIRLMDQPRGIGQTTEDLSAIPEDPIQQMTVGSTTIPSQAGKITPNDLLNVAGDAVARARDRGRDYLLAGGPRGLPIDLAFQLLYGGKLPADVRAFFGEEVPPEGSFNPEDLIDIGKAKGGPVHMQFGGQPTDELSGMMEALDPNRESRDSPTFEATKFFATQIPKSLVSPLVGIYGTLKSGKYGTQEGIRAGEKAMEEFMMPGQELSPEAMEKVQGVADILGKIETEGKIPPGMPELFGPITGAIQGMGPQVRSLATQAAGRARDMAAEVPPLPVGLSTQPVGKSIAEVLETKPGKVKVEADDLGFYSPVEKALANSPRKQGTGQAFINDITRFSPSKGELEATGIFDWLKDQKSVTKEQVLDYLDQNRVQIEEVVRGTVLDDVDRQRFNDINRRISQGFQELVTPEDEEFFEATRARLSQFKEPRFERENLILPGGKNYREMLLKLPAEQSKDLIKLKEEANNLDRQLVDLRVAYRNALELDPKSDETLRLFSELRKVGAQKERAKFNLEEVVAESKEKTFQTNHWPDDPNTLAHMRMQDMDIGGKKTLVVEEIQSDWHQQGREKGYQKPELEESVEMTRLRQEYDVAAKKRRELFRLIENGDDADPNIRMAATEAGKLSEELKLLSDEMSEIRSRQKSGVPNAPFKKDWYQLAIKRLLKYAADNDYEQIALVGPEEQIRRGSLGTHIDGLYFQKNPDGSIKLEAEKNGSIVLDKSVEPKDLELYVGKDVAQKIMNSKEGDGTLTGDDLQIGGEGMRQYYDRTYPDSINKIGKKYGTKANKINRTLREYGPDDVEERETGEVDRYGRPGFGYLVRDPETGEDVAYEYTFEKALEEANKKAPSTSMWVMDLPANMKSDVKVGQPYKKGGAVKKMQMGGAVINPFNTVPDINDSGEIINYSLEQELKRYG